MDVEIRTREPQKTMRVRCVITEQQIGDAFMTHMPKVFASVGDRASGPMFGLYNEFSKERVDLEIGVPVDEHLPPEGDVQPGEIKGGRYATTTHVGPYDTLGQTYDALYAWIRDNGHSDAGPPLEFYVNDPQTTPTDQLRTDIFVPLA